MRVQLLCMLVLAPILANQAGLPLAEFGTHLKEGAPNAAVHELAGCAGLQ